MKLLNYWKKIHLHNTVIGHTDAEEDKVGLDKPMYSKMDQKRAKKVYDELVAYDIDSLVNNRT